MTHKSTLHELGALSKEELIRRVLDLQETSAASPKFIPATSSTPSPSKPLTKADKQPKHKKPSPPFSSHPTRHIALLVTYAGWPYSGLALQPPSPHPPSSSSAPQGLPTVESHLLAALTKTHLIDGALGWEGCEFSRCGRTDRGVSSAGQVVSLWVRSRRKMGDGGVELSEDWKSGTEAVTETPKVDSEDKETSETTEEKPKKPSNKIPKPPQPPHENPYPSLLNRVLPDDIRVLAWSPLPYSPTAPDEPPRFDARFSTQSRKYLYTFPLHPLPAPYPPLDLPAMQLAANHLVGEHDFRNFCKLDGSKQIENHKRRILSAVVRERGVGEGVLELEGTAFLWHMVRCIMGVLFLVGSGHEAPEVVRKLLTIEEGVDIGKPNYQMAAALPLQLASCEYSPGVVDWRYGGYDGPFSTLSVPEKRELGGTPFGLLKQLSSLAEYSRVKHLHELSFYQKALELHADALPEEAEVGLATWTTGAGEMQSTRRYVEVEKRDRGDGVEEVNRKWREGGGERRRLRREKGGSEGGKDDGEKEE